MGLVKCAIIGVTLILVIGLFINQEGPKTIELPEIWWGPGHEREQDKSVIPFKITFLKKDIDDLKSRLNNTRSLKSTFEGVGWTYGVNSAFIPGLVDYWLNNYDFKKREVHMNQYPQFTTNVQGLNIHFLHVKPKQTEGKRVLPLLVQHGWPGSVVEFYKVIPLLTTPRPEHDFVFEVIIPSLPGFGFSSAAVRPGLGSAEMAVVLKNLMLRLGFDKFYTQGGDWGAVVTAHMASMFPQHVMGMHSNMCLLLLRPWIFFKTILYGFFPSLIVSKEDYHLMYPLSHQLSKLIRESGYFHIQATKPDTVGVGLSDSPVGLAAYILEKFSTATNLSNIFEDDGGIFVKFTPDELLDNIMLYWISNCMTTSMRIYAENFITQSAGLKLESVPIEVPSACAQFPYEITYQPPAFLRERYKNLIRVTRMPRGGHFAALEEPNLLADDVWASIAAMEVLRQKETKK